MPHDFGFTPSIPQLVIPTWMEIWRSLEIAVLPQLSLTLTNAVIVTASLSRELFPATGSLPANESGAVVGPGERPAVARSAQCRCATVRVDCRLNIVSGLEPGWPRYFRRRGARAGGRLCQSCCRAVCDHPDWCGRGAADPGGTDLAMSRRLFDGKPSCLPVIGVAALITLTVNPALGLAVGWGAELVRNAIMRRISQRYS